MEAQGTGIHIVMSAKTALELGAPIRGILAFTSTSTYVHDLLRWVPFIDHRIVTKLADLSLLPVAALSQSPEKYHPSTPSLSSTSITARANFPSAAPRFRSGLTMNARNFNKNSNSERNRASPLTTNILPRVSPLWRKKPSSKRRTHSLCMVCSRDPIPVSPLSAAHLLSGDLLLTTSVFFRFMVRVLEQT